MLPLGTLIHCCLLTIYVVTHNIPQLQALSDALFLLNFPTSSGVRSPDICSLFRSSEVPVRLTILRFLSQLFYSFQILGSLILPILHQDVHCISVPVSWPDDYHLLCSGNTTPWSWYDSNPFRLFLKYVISLFAFSISLSSVRLSLYISRYSNIPSISFLSRYSRIDFEASFIYTLDATTQYGYNVYTTTRYGYYWRKHYDY